MSCTHISIEGRAIIGALLDALAESAPAEDSLPGQPVPAAMVQPGYARGVIDLLSLLGAVRPRSDGATVEAISPQAGWAIRMLRAFLDMDAPIIADWESRGITPVGAGRPQLRSPDLLATLEARRQSLAPGAAPLREVEASTGLISRRGEAGNPELLLVYDPSARSWQLPGGHCDSTDATPEAALLRELHEELGLPMSPASNEIALEPLPQVCETRMSPTYGLLTRVSFHMYRVILSRPYVGDRPDVRWVNMGEAEAGRTNDGMDIAIGPLRILAAQSGTRIIDVLASARSSVACVRG